MGSSFSSTTNEAAHPLTAKVIALDGSLIEYAVPTTASDVLGSGHTSCFLCSSDRLFFDALIPALGSGDLLELDQIYFVLPDAKRNYPLSIADMVALAGKASVAIAAASKKRGKGRKIRVVPLEEVPDVIGEDTRVHEASRWSSGLRRGSHSSGRTLAAIQEVADDQ